MTVKRLFKSCARQLLALQLIRIALESDLQASYNLRGGLTTVVRTGIINIPAKAFHLFHPLRRLSPIRLHGECDSLRCGWTASYYDKQYGL